MDVLNTLIAFLAVCFSGYQTLALRRERSSRGAPRPPTGLILPAGVSLPRQPSADKSAQPRSAVDSSRRWWIADGLLIATLFRFPLVILPLIVGVRWMIRGRKAEGVILIGAALIALVFGVPVYLATA
jgi:hypothetical protein